MIDGSLSDLRLTTVLATHLFDIKLDDQSVVEKGKAKNSTALEQRICL